ncbi:MAG: S-layer homology domain-containing protein [Acidobacteriota bacterium]
MRVVEAVESESPNAAMPPERGRNRAAGAAALTVALVIAAGWFAGAGQAGTTPMARAGLTTTITGVVTLVWGDGSREQPESIGPLAILTDAAGNDVELRLDDATVKGVGGLLALNRRRVTVSGSWTAATSGRTGAAVVVTDLRFEDGQSAAPEVVTGAQPWVSIMCKFSDVATEPKTLSYFQGMYSSAYPGIDHFWRRVSYDNVNVVGSTASGWFTLPHPRSYYIVNDSANLDALFADCTGAADPSVNFSPYVGINMMFNDTLDCCAWGGGHWATLDGVTKIWRVTWEPPWGYANSSVISHEMGHGFGLPHSSFNRNSVYDNCWDVMSDTWNCNTTDATYGKLGQHTISFHKDLLGWFRAPEKLTLSVGQSTSATLERLATPGWPIAKMVQVPIAGSSSHFYTIEARQRVTYDGNLAGNAVIVHEVDTTQTIPAVVKGTNGYAGAIWGVGSLFRDDANGIGMTVTATAADGFTVAVSNGSSLAASFPAVDAYAAAGTSSNLNGVLEPGETVQVETGWTNVSTGSVSATGSATTFTGPAGATYTLPDASAAYGTIASTATTNCQDAGDCYVVGVSNPATRPATHWDATLTENLSSGGSKQWVLHVGRSFTDVAPGAFGYSFVETLLHKGITAGCGNGKYCPADGITRWQMAVFLATALSGPSVPVAGTVEGLGSYNCVAGGTSLFSDVAPTDTGCKFIHYIAARKVTAGCGGGRFCPGDAVTRWQMAVFLATSMAGTDVPSSGTVPSKGPYNCTASGGTSVFLDVPANDAGCKFIHYIAATGVTAGCNPGYYCPAESLRRDQMAVFVSTAFGYSLYGP